MSDNSGKCSSNGNSSSNCGGKVPSLRWDDGVKEELDAMEIITCQIT